MVSKGFFSHSTYFFRFVSFHFVQIALIFFGKLFDITAPLKCRSCLDFCLVLHFQFFSFFPSFFSVFFGTIHTLSHACTTCTQKWVSVRARVCVPVCASACVFLFVFSTNNLPAMSNKSFAIVELPHKHTTNVIHYTMAGDFFLCFVQNSHCSKWDSFFLAPWYCRLYVLFLFDYYFVFSLFTDVKIQTNSQSLAQSRFIIYFFRQTLRIWRWI